MGDDRRRQEPVGREGADVDHVLAALRTRLEARRKYTWRRGACVGLGIAALSAIAAMVSDPTHERLAVVLLGMAILAILGGTIGGYVLGRLRERAAEPCGSPESSDRPAPDLSWPTDPGFTCDSWWHGPGRGGGTRIADPSSGLSVEREYGLDDKPRRARDELAEELRSMLVDEGARTRRHGASGLTGGSEGRQER